MVNAPAKAVVAFQLHGVTINIKFIRVRESFGVTVCRGIHDHYFCFFRNIDAINDRWVFICTKEPEYWRVVTQALFNGVWYE